MSIEDRPGKGTLPAARKRADGGLAHRPHRGRREASIAGARGQVQVLKVACVGAGYFSSFHLDAWVRIENTQVVGVADQDRKALRARAHGFAHFAEASVLFGAETPDIVDIITPPPTHLGLIREALRTCPRAIVCQKPFCQDLAEAERAVGLAEEAQIPLIIHENFRFQPWYRVLKDMLVQGGFGEVLQVTFRLRPGDGQGPDAYLDRQPYFQKMPRFLIHETAVHWIDTFRFLLGQPDTVWADLRRLNPVIAGEDAGLVVFGYADGKCALFDGNRLSDHPAANRRRTMGECLIEGTKMTAMLDGDGRIFIRSFGSNDWSPHPFEAPETGFGGDCVHALQSHVVAHLETGSSLENEARDYLAVIRMEEAIYRSHETRQRITL
ncbi:MAG: Gfo/Idh/MocA family oxidoreductase [Pseudomonadota bacterium]